jgi:ubiquinone/menaquinone biosynthesis C-methylase UbiE
MDKSNSIKYFNQQAAQWDSSPRVYTPEELQEMADRIAIKKDAWVVDIGTGTGVFFPFIFSKLNREGLIISVDFAIQMLLQAQ